MLAFEDSLGLQGFQVCLGHLDDGFDDDSVFQGRPGAQEDGDDIRTGSRQGASLGDAEDRRDALQHKKRRLLGSAKD